jgi:hypothetical protein
VVWRALDTPLGGACRLRLHEHRPEYARRAQPSVELVSVRHPVVRVEGAQAGLLVDRVEGLLGAPGEHVRLLDARHDLLAQEQGDVSLAVPDRRAA